MLPFPHSKNTPLRRLCTLGIGGDALYTATCKTIVAMQEMLTYCARASLPFLVIGKGSNCLFDDRGFNGLVIINHIDSLEQEGSLFHVGAGYSFARLGGQTARAGYTGLEFAAGIPASVGGAIFMNAGASGQQTEDVLSAVLFVDHQGVLHKYDRRELTFGYRSSSFQAMRGAIVAADFLLASSNEAKGVQKKLLDYRLQTQPYSEKSAGCAFRNPSGSSAGRLIEECGLKGHARGGARVSTKHANFVVNDGSATSSDVRALIEEIKETIFAKKGVILEEEIRVIPYE